MFKRLVIPLVFFLGFAGTITWTQLSPYWGALSRVSRVMRLVHEESVYEDRVDYERLSNAAIDGMLESLDRYSRYMMASDYARYEAMSQQRYVGVGIEIEQVGERVTVVGTFKGGPAAEAGVIPGDQILRVDGANAEDWTVEAVSDALKGIEGESTQVVFYRPSTERTSEMTLVRRFVSVESVRDVRVNAEGFGYLRLVQFGEKTGLEFREALGRLKNPDLKGLVIDLRDNGGGLLTAAREVAEVFFEKGALIVSTEGRNGGDTTSLYASGETIDLGYKVVVLVNGLSASASEIVAGAWQDKGKAYLIGETTYGKGSVQSVYVFRDGAGMRQTTALYYLPSGRSINETGVTPDLLVEMDDEAERRLRLQERHLGYLSDEAFEEFFGFKPDQEDLQLEAAWVYLRSQNEG